MSNNTFYTGEYCRFPNEEIPRIFDILRANGHPVWKDTAAYQSHHDIVYCSLDGDMMGYTSTEPECATELTRHDFMCKALRFDLISPFLDNEYPREQVSQITMEIRKLTGDYHGGLSIHLNDGHKHGLSHTEWCKRLCIEPIGVDEAQGTHTCRYCGAEVGDNEPDEGCHAAPSITTKDESKAIEPSLPPYKTGDKVRFHIDGKEGTVKSCCYAIGGWRILASVCGDNDRDFLADRVEMINTNEPMAIIQTTQDEEDSYFEQLRQEQIIRPPKPIESVFDPNKPFTFGGNHKSTDEYGSHGRFVKYIGTNISNEHVLEFTDGSYHTFRCPLVNFEPPETPIFTLTCDPEYGDDLYQAVSDAFDDFFRHIEEHIEDDAVGVDMIHEAFHEWLSKYCKS